MESPVPEQLKADIPRSTFGKILAATPVVMTVVATLLAGLASSEMTSAQYDRSLAAQQQSKAGDQWGYFQAKRMRSALQHNALDILQATGVVRPLDLSALKQAVGRLPPDTTNSQTDLLTWLESGSGQAALAALAKGEPLHIPASAPLDPDLQAAAEAMANGRPDSETTHVIAQVKPASVEAALRAAQDRTQAFDAVAKPENQAIDLFDRLLSRDPSSEGAGLRRDFTAARLRFTAERYDAEARLNQGIANLYEVQVHLSNFTAEHHRVRSQRFFFGMLMAQAAVIVSTLAMAARLRSILWSVAAVAGLVAIGFAVYVYLCV